MITKKPTRPLLNLPKLPRTPPTKETICYHCNKTIESKNDYIIIARKLIIGVVLCFHTDCFNEIAGTEYIEQLNLLEKKCMNCNKKHTTDKLRSGVLCADCESSIPPCDKCQAPMRIRFNRRDNSSFLGCSKYPICKNTRKI